MLYCVCTTWVMPCKICEPPFAQNRQSSSGRSLLVWGAITACWLCLDMLHDLSFKS